MSSSGLETMLPSATLRSCFGIEFGSWISLTSQIIGQNYSCPLNFGLEIITSFNYCPRDTIGGCYFGDVRKLTPDVGSQATKCPLKKESWVWRIDK